MANDRIEPKTHPESNQKTRGARGKILLGAPCRSWAIVCILSSPSPPLAIEEGRGEEVNRVWIPSAPPPLDPRRGRDHGGGVLECGLPAPPLQAGSPLPPWITRASLRTPAFRLKGKRQRLPQSTRLAPIRMCLRCERRHSCRLDRPVAFHAAMIAASSRPCAQRSARPTLQAER